ncbi:MAG TPA: hypothetical protein VIP98_06085 [Microlunatus sp.]
MGKNRRQPAQPPSNRYPGRNQPGRKQMPQRSTGQQARLWILSLCGAVPGAVVVYLTQNFWIGAGVFLGVVIVLGFILYQYEKRKQQ